MQNAIVPRQQAQGMSSCRIVGLTLGAVVLGFLLLNVPDVLRYLRISSM